MKSAESNGWLLLSHPDFDDEYSALLREVQKIKKRDGANFAKHKTVKLLKALQVLVYDVIPSDPASPAYLQGNTLGPDFRAWRRAKLSQQHRLFFRFDSTSKIIIYVWVNNEGTLRAYGKKTDAYRTFEKKLNSGHPPTDWLDLLEEASQ